MNLNTSRNTLEGVAVAEMVCPRYDFTLLFRAVQILIPGTKCLVLPAARYFVPQQSNQNVSVVHSYATALLSYFGLTWAKGIELDMASGTKPAPPLLATWVQIHSLGEVGNVYRMRLFEATSQKRLPLTVLSPGVAGNRHRT